VEASDKETTWQIQTLMGR